jgi:hypothetical protein
MKIYPKPPEEPWERWGTSYYFRVWYDARRPYRSVLTYATEADAIRECIYYCRATFAPRHAEEETEWDE